MIITIGRQFGSGGNEVARKLSEKLGYHYYDKDIVSQIAKESGLHPKFIEKFSEEYITRVYPYTFIRAFDSYQQNPYEQVQIAQHQVIKALAGDKKAIFVGRGADYILRDEKILKVFIYSSDMDKRIERCYYKDPSDKEKSPKEMEKSIIQVDKSRSKYYEQFTGKKWGDMDSYNLCIDTAILGVDGAVSVIEAYVNSVK